jgi:hypothetical protein
MVQFLKENASSGLTSVRDGTALVKENLRGGRVKRATSADQHPAKGRSFGKCHSNPASNWRGEPRIARQTEHLRRALVFVFHSQGPRIRRRPSVGNMYPTLSQLPTFSPWSFCGSIASKDG